MADVTMKSIDDLESYQGPAGRSGQFLYAAKSIGVTAWGMNVLRRNPREGLRAAPAMRRPGPLRPSGLAEAA
jgi:hypothetical protein